MGKKRIVTAEAQATPQSSAAGKTLGLAAKKKLTHGVIHIHSTYNNTKLTLTDPAGDVVFWSSSGLLGFSGTKRGTPFAASKVAELLADRAVALGLREVEVAVKGVGAGRESALRTLAARGLVINSVRDATPIPFNGPKPAKPRRV